MIADTPRCSNSKTGVVYLFFKFSYPLSVITKSKSESKNQSKIKSVYQKQHVQ